MTEADSVLNLSNYFDRRPGQLSGGQRQRVAIVREPSAFLFDGPLSNLDAALRGTMRLEISELRQQLQYATRRGALRTRGLFATRSCRSGQRELC
ncbi:UNVERIFIED_ORG: ABC-type sugar transport system ATPase subunit [Ensifer adhaerens]|nr:ABC-type sugar transport system ATPase subunit [Ensifer adhaerens]